MHHAQLQQMSQGVRHSKTIAHCCYNFGVVIYNADFKCSEQTPGSRSCKKKKDREKCCTQRFRKCLFQTARHSRNPSGHRCFSNVSAHGNPLGTEYEEEYSQGICENCNVIQTLFIVTTRQETDSLKQIRLSESLPAEYCGLYICSVFINLKWILKNVYSYTVYTVLCSFINPLAYMCQHVKV